MAQQVLGQGPGNLVPDSETRMFLANGAVVKGDVLTVLTNGYTVDQCSTILPGLVVAKESGTDVWIECVVGGFCDFITNDGTDIVANDLLYSGAGVAVPLALGTDIGVQGGGCFGMSLQAQTGTTITAAIIFKRV